MLPRSLYVGMTSTTRIASQIRLLLPTPTLA
jgi:hypothetical protein